MSSISISSPADNSHPGATFTATGTYTYSSGPPPITCYIEGKTSGGGGGGGGGGMEEEGPGEEGGENEISVLADPISASGGTWSAVFTGIPAGSNYTLKAELGGSTTQKTGIAIP